MSNRRIFEHTPVDLGYENLGDASISGKRIYITPEGNHYPSITTVLGVRSKEFLEAWRKRVGEKEADRIGRHAATRGTAMHNIAEKYLNNDDDYFDKNEMPHVKAMFRSIQPVLDSNIGRILLQEKPLYAEHLHVAGRVDLVSEYNGLNSIVDFKTSSRVKSKDDVLSYFIQTSAYAIMVEERTGIPISQIVIVMAVENSNKPLVFIEKRDNYVDELFKVIAEYNLSL